MRLSLSLIVALTLSVPQFVVAQKTVTMNPNDIQLSPLHHQKLPPSLLKRIRTTTDVFEKIDGVSYEQAVDLYKRDLNPEENLVLWEEMVKAYTAFCKARCASKAEQRDVYQALLLRTMFNDEEVLRRAKPQVLKPSEVSAVIKLYRLAAKPIDVVKVK